MKFQIKNRFTGDVQFECELTAELADAHYSLQIGFAVKKAIEVKANLRYADLRYANLRYADLRSADLRYADLRSADLRYANLRYANLRYANLRYADLSSANLRYANLSSANLSSADLRSAKNIPEAYYTLCRDDLWAVLSAAPREVGGLRAALIAGRVDGSTYEGECACLVGTIANVSGKNYQSLGSLKPNSERPIERFFMSIKRDDTPETNDFSKRAVEWIDEWTANITAAFCLPVAGSDKA